MRFLAALLVFIVLITNSLSCKKDNVKVNEDEVLKTHLNIPGTPFNYFNPALPSFFADQFVRIQDNTPADNPVTDWGATLGRVLFYDNRLSKNLSISCGSCHVQEFGFTDTAQFSKGFDGRFTKRHSMALANASFYLNGRFFWDERAASLEDQVLMPVVDSLEMGMRLDSLMVRLKATQFYPVLFNKAFGSPEITADRTAKALAQFVRSMVSYQSKYDLGRAMVTSRTDAFPNFTPEENLGKDIFMNRLPINCFGCHNTDVFITDNPRNNGTHLTNPDPGVFIHTNDPMDIGKFKAPSLKNVALRHRYMHDGQIIGLDQVLSHYNDGIHPNENLDLHLKVGGKPARMNLTAAELAALKSFLGTLTDEVIIRDEKFSSPF